MVLQEHVQGFRHSDKELSEFLSKQELSEIERVTNRPFFLINKIHREVKKMIDDHPTIAHLSQSPIDTLSTHNTYPLAQPLKPSTLILSTHLHNTHAHNPPSHSIQVRKIPETSEFTSRERQTMQKYVDDMSKTIGASERIVQVGHSRRLVDELTN